MRPKKTYASQLTIKDQQVTDYDHYLSRRDFIQSGIVASAGLLGMAYTGSLAAESAAARSTATKAHKSANVKSGGMSQWFDVDEKLSSYKSITTYNNFYEFGTDKSDPAKHAHKLTTQPWTVEVMGECEKPGKVALEQLFKAAWLEERTYRFRCVEGWSMVIPWQGVQLSKVLAPFKPTSKAKYVVFETLYRPKEMFKQNTSIMEWPYVEGLRMDEAMHPLTMLATGIYGKDLLNQNGAPLRLVVPWKYGFKGIKSIVKIAFVEQQPINSWQKANRHEYGFYSNVNPQVPHPRWSQAKERRIGELFKRDTLMFNGYADAVADLYSGMDLKKHI